MTTAASKSPSYGSYLIIWAWLMALLLVGTFSTTLPISKAGIVGVILGISLTKAILVSLFYMHLKFEKFVPLWLVATFPFLLLAFTGALLLTGLLFLR